MLYSASQLFAALTLSLLRPVTTSICPERAILRTFSASFGSVGGMLVQSSHASSRNWKNCSLLIPSLRQEAQVSMSESLRFVPETRWRVCTMLPLFQRGPRRDRLRFSTAHCESLTTGRF